MRMEVAGFVGAGMTWHDAVMRLAACFGIVLMCLVGCAQVREYRITTSPPDARILVNGAEVGSGAVRVRMSFSEDRPTNVLGVTRDGFRDARQNVTLATAGPEIKVTLEPQTRPLEVVIDPPIEASIQLDGQAVGRGPRTRIELPFRIDSTGRAVPGVLRASAANFAPVEVSVPFVADQSQVVLKLNPLSKNLTLRSIPEGAKLELDGRAIGQSPVMLKDVPFEYDIASQRFKLKSLVARLPGYRDTLVGLDWDEGSNEAVVRMQTFAKTVEIIPEPSDAVARLNGEFVAANEEGRRLVTLEFLPDAEANLPTFEFDLTHERAGELWEPSKLVVGWDEGRDTYNLKLREIMERPTTLRTLGFESVSREWKLAIRTIESMAYKLPTTGPGDPGMKAAVRVMEVPEQFHLQSYAVSPDGSSIVVGLVEFDGDRPTTRIARFPVDGRGGMTFLGDGTTTDLAPTFSPDGKSVVFSSDRGGGRFNIWSIPVDGQGGATRLSGGSGDHLYPSLDAGRTPRVFYQAMLPRQTQPRLYSSVVGTTLETELLPSPARQPRLAPTFDRLVFVVPTGQDGLGDLATVSDKGGAGLTKLTETPTIDEYDPSFSSDGSRVIFALREPIIRDGQSVLPLESDVYVIDLNGGAKQRITSNSAIDDQPQWDPIREAVYFRSNRGGTWGIWRVEVP